MGEGELLSASEPHEKDDSKGLRQRAQGVAAGVVLLAVAGTLLYFAAKNTGTEAPSVSAGLTTSTTQRFPGQIGGTFSLNDDMPSYQTIGDVCEGDGGYSDISAHTQVTVTDAEGKIVAVGNLGTGRWTGQRFAPTCVFTFMIEDVPKLDLYQIEVGRRGKVVYRYDALATAGFRVAVSLGD